MFKKENILKTSLSLSLTGAILLALSAGSLQAAEPLPSTSPSSRSESGADSGDGFYFPANRWSYQHMEQLYPSASLDRGDIKVSSLPLALQNFDNFPVKTIEGQTIGLDSLLKKNYTDAFVVVKDGKIVYEKYYNGQTPRTRHQMMSVTKSISATAIQPLIASGKIDPQAQVTKYIPELKKSAWADATVQQVLDMTVSLNYDEDYDNTRSGFNEYLRAMQFTKDSRQAPAHDMRDFLTKVQKDDREHGKIFQYATVNTDVMCWIAERASGQSPEELLQDNLWSKIGADRDSYILMDSKGTSFCGAGLNATARDLAKFGVIMANDGKLGDQQIVSSEFIKTLEKGGSHQAFDQSHYGHIDFLKNWTYKDQWWIRGNANHAFSAIGIYGQTLYVDPTENVVVVKQTSRKVAQNGDDGEMFNAIDTIINALK